MGIGGKEVLYPLMLAMMQVSLKLCDKVVKISEKNHKQTHNISKNSYIDQQLSPMYEEIGQNEGDQLLNDATS